MLADDSEYSGSASMMIRMELWWYGHQFKQFIIFEWPSYIMTYRFESFWMTLDNNVNEMILDFFLNH